MNLRKNLSALDQPLRPQSSLLVKGQSKKIEGYDKTSSSTIAFNSKIEKIKNKPKKQALEDQYIKGLQDEIHYLQLELKLLKEKDLAKHNQIDQLEKFFGDGIPINQNILAIKNGFNNYKVGCENRIAELSHEKKQREELNKGLRQKMQRLIKDIYEKQKSQKDFVYENAHAFHEKIKEEKRTKKELQNEEQILRNLKGENRKLNEKLVNLQRTREIMMVGNLKQTNKNAKLSKLKESIRVKEREYEKLEGIYDDLKKQEEQKTYVINIEEDNIKLKKKIIALEKQLNALLVKVQEKKMDLEGRLKERHKEINARMDMQKRLGNTKQTVNRENSLSIEELQKVAKERQIIMLQKIVQNNKKTSKYLGYYGELLSKVQESLQQLGEKKPQLKREINVYKNEVNSIQKDLQKEQARQYELCSQLAQKSSVRQHLLNIIPPIVEKIKKSSDQLRVVKVEKERVSQEINVKDKQLQLIQILKGLSLQEVEISNSSNSHIQTRILSFIRNWETLNRN